MRFPWLLFFTTLIVSAVSLAEELEEKPCPEIVPPVGVSQQRYEDIEWFKHYVFFPSDAPFSSEPQRDFGKRLPADTDISNFGQRYQEAFRDEQ